MNIPAIAIAICGGYKHAYSVHVEAGQNRALANAGYIAEIRLCE